MNFFRLGKKDSPCIHFGHYHSKKSHNTLVKGRAIEGAVGNQIEEYLLFIKPHEVSYAHARVQRLSIRTCTRCVCAHAADDNNNVCGTDFN